MLTSGLLNINKHPGITSFRAVSIVKNTLNVRKAGHCGTLDPAAEGVLLVLFGKATKLQGKLIGLPKTYYARILLGTVTDSGDTTGKVLRSSEVNPESIKEIESVVAGFSGEILQIPPMFSALKYGGKKLYEFARAGREVPREPRKISIYSIKTLNIRDNRIELRVECSRGTYIRTLAVDIGDKLGCGGTLEYLRREKIGPFDIDDSISINGKLDVNDLLSRAMSEENILQITDIPDSAGTP
ncbi:MAG: tRNA pseudouridine(55) synthase TruB [Elusimicrobiota bacterium]